LKRAEYPSRLSKCMSASPRSVGMKAVPVPNASPSSEPSPTRYAACEFFISTPSVDLQTAADAAALSGAEQLQERYVKYTLPSQTAQNAIFTTATTNTRREIRGTLARLEMNIQAGNVPVTMRDDDVSFSFLDANGIFHPNYRGEGLGGGFPNSITVV